MEQLLEMFHRFSKLVDQAFYNDPRFLTSRDKVSPVEFFDFFFELNVVELSFETDIFYAV